MAKPQPWYASWSQSPKGPHHGKHRRTSPKAHSDSANGTGAGNDGADAFSSAVTPKKGTVFRTSLLAASWRILLGGQPLSAGIDPSQGTGLISNYHAYVLLHEPSTIPYAGIRAGEITGHRAWFLYQGKLCSIAHFFLWEPGKVITGDINAHVGRIWNPIMGGVYAFSTLNHFRAAMAKWDSSWPKLLYRNKFDYADPYQVDGIVWGTISMWGNVVEHEKGYRAEFAKITSLREALGQCYLPDLRKLYGIPQ